MKEKNRNTSLFSYGLEMVILMMVFLVVVVLLVQIYGNAIKESQKAKMLQDGVQICRTAAEAYSSNGDLLDVIECFTKKSKDQECLYFDDQLQVVETIEAADYELDYEENKTSQGLKKVHFTVLDQNQEVIYELTTEKYLPEGSR